MYATNLTITEKKIKSLEGNIPTKWNGSALRDESTLHQIAPYIGKIKSSIAKTLINTFTHEGESVYDPFCGSGTIPFEAWAARRCVIANDMNPYANTLTLAKLFPYYSLKDSSDDIHCVAEQTKKIIASIDLRKVPGWVRSFFHPETLRETIAWSQVLRSRKLYFLLSCLLGILHHQRPGFLSFPSCHGVPYLRDRNFPRDLYPDLYEYRAVQERLERKVQRTLKRVPKLDSTIYRKCYNYNVIKFIPERRIDAIITSPPYMQQLDYGRDNRLRLWFLGIPDWKSLDYTISPSENKFIDLITSCLKLWHNILTPQGICVFILGDIYSKILKMPLPDAVAQIATKEIGGYSVIWKYTESIPNERRVRRNHGGTRAETIIVLRKNM